MKLNKKDTITLVVATMVIGLVVFFMIRLLFPPKQVTTETESSTIPTVPSTIDETTYKNVENLSDYGTVSLEGLGKSNLFAGF